MQIKANTPMVGPKTDLEPLQREFANDLVYSRKVGTNYLWSVEIDSLVPARQVAID